MVSLRQSLIHGGKAFGSLILSNSPVVAELMAHVGYDFLLVDHEHSPTGIGSGQAILQAINTAPNTEPIVRLPCNDPVYMKKVLDSMKLPGGVLVPMVDTPEMARKVVESTRYPLQGIRGAAVPVVRGSGWGLEEDYLKQCNEDLLVMVQVETVDGVDNIEEIAGVDGVDLVFLGPYDLSASIGKLGQFDDPEVIKLINDAEKKIRKAPNCLLGGFRAPGRPIDEMFGEGGYSLVAGSIDVALLREAARNDLENGKITE
mmetsp:Transcript_5404/g.7806  ORF Transcript_5404/g.7806 Transcript_5404/m.7806 type:complete len:259 (+) Transcript_5404:72-848(+)